MTSLEEHTGMLNCILFTELYNLKLVLDCRLTPSALWSPWLPIPLSQAREPPRGHPHVALRSHGGCLKGCSCSAGRAWSFGRRDNAVKTKWGLILLMQTVLDIQMMKSKLTQMSNLHLFLRQKLRIYVKLHGQPITVKGRLEFMGVWTSEASVSQQQTERRLNNKPRIFRSWG